MSVKFNRTKFCILHYKRRCYVKCMFYLNSRLFVEMENNENRMNFFKIIEINKPDEMNNFPTKHNEE